MHKIGIIGPGSADVAALIAQHYSGLHPECEFITLGEVESVSFEPAHRVESYGPIAMSHSFKAHYRATEEQAEWLRTQALAYEQVKSQSEIWDDLIKQAPPIMREWDAEAKAAEYQTQRYTRQFTQPHPPTIKARKAARRRAKAGRRASR